MAETRGMNFFSEENVLERFKKPPSYFEKISTVAFKPVSNNRSSEMFEYIIEKKNKQFFMYLKVP